MLPSWNVQKQCNAGNWHHCEFIHFTYRVFRSVSYVATSRSLHYIQQFLVSTCHINTVRLWVSDSIKHLAQTKSTSSTKNWNNLFFTLCLSVYAAVSVAGSTQQQTFCQWYFCLMLLPLLPIFLPVFFRVCVQLALGTWCACFITLWLSIRYGKTKGKLEEKYKPNEPLMRINNRL